ncbi:quinone oxidoreductase family protein [Rhodococcus sp. UNC363MFTsu5.1]|uniref:quinone oxidoreductase family protein n=1 Tax=Rhodococcus sp. UNC363MFTsu5.1 TaxID=1449069 RepID=UPI0012DDF213|nr:zinc-binding dehydrogenase [Rhodococcus sp. UNC363MFTsu5.1]
MTSVGGPDVLVERDVPAPEPAVGEVVIRAEAIGVHFAETQLRSGIFPSPIVPPFVFGGEAAGTVVEVGEGVDRGMIGTRVIAMTDGTGAYAERVVAAAAATVLVPDGLSLADAVAVAVPGAVALTLLRAAGLRGGEVVLVEAAASGVGAYLTQLAGEFGAARVLATAGTGDKRERARSFGADDVVDHSGPDWPGRVREVLGGATLDVVFESVGGESAAQLLDLMTPLEGRMLCYGLLSGRPAAVGPVDLMQRGLTLTGCSGPAWLGRVAAARAEILERAAAGTVTPVVDSVLPLGDAALAHEKIEKRVATGKVILAPTVRCSSD